MFDFQFVSFACETIPGMLSTGENPSRDRRDALEVQLIALNKRNAACFEFMEMNPDLASETGTRIRAIRDERAVLELELGLLRVAEPPAQGFEFGDAVGLFLPAYLDVYPSGTAEAENSFRARALFTSRVIEAIAGVTVAIERNTYSVRLKNGVEVAQELSLDMLFVPAQQHLDDDELGQLCQYREEGLQTVHRLNNARTSKPSSSDSKPASKPVLGDDPIQ